MNKVGSEVTLTLESSPSNADGDPAWTTSRLYSSFKPFLSVLRVCGFYFENNNHLPQTERKYRNTVSKIYGFVVILILVFELLRAISVFQYANAFGPELLLILYNVSWLSNNACKCFPQFFSRHEEILREYAVNYPRKIIAQKVWIATGTCITLLLINAVLFTYVLFYTNVFDLIHMTFENLGAGSWVRIIMMCPYVYHSILWIFPPALFLLFCEMLKSIFNDYSIGLKKTLSMDLIDPILFERKRKEFSDLCRLVNDADEVFCCFCGTTIFLYVVNLCVNLYLILWFEEIRSSQVGTAAVAMWFGTGVLVLTIIAVGAAGVNCQIHELVDCLHYNMSTQQLTTWSHNATLNLFLNQLTTQPIGLSVFKLFVIDKAMILTILGMLITYFLLIMQYSPAFLGTDVSSTNSSSCS